MNKSYAIEHEQTPERHANVKIGSKRKKKLAKRTFVLMAIVSLLILICVAISFLLRQPQTNYALTDEEKQLLKINNAINSQTGKNLELGYSINNIGDIASKTVKTDNQIRLLEISGTAIINTKAYGDMAANYKASVSTKLADLNLSLSESNKIATIKLDMDKLIIDSLELSNISLVDNPEKQIPPENILGLTNSMNEKLKEYIIDNIDLKGPETQASIKNMVTNLYGSMGVEKLNLSFTGGSDTNGYESGVTQKQESSELSYEK